MHTNVRGVIKQFGDWYNKINTYQAIHTKFRREYKTTIVLLVVKIWTRYVNNCTYNHHIQFTWHGNMVRSPLSSVSFYKVIVFHRYSLYFSLLVSYTKVKYQLKQSFYINIKFDELSSEIDNALHISGPQALTVTWVSETLNSLLFWRAHICISTAPS